MIRSENLDALNAALSDAQGEFEAVSKTARDKNRNPLDPCPHCGQLKLKRAKRCKQCASQAQVGVAKTAFPKEGASHYRARQLCPQGSCSFDGCTKDGSHVHHIDGNAFNNNLANLIRLCPRHHMTIDGRLDAARARAARVGKLYGGRPKKVVK